MKSFSLRSLPRLRYTAFHEGNAGSSFPVRRDRRGLRFPLRGRRGFLAAPDSRSRRRLHGPCRPDRLLGHLQGKRFSRSRGEDTLELLLQDHLSPGLHEKKRSRSGSFAFSRTKGLRRLFPELLGPPSGAPSQPENPRRGGRRGSDLPGQGARRGFQAALHAAYRAFLDEYGLYEPNYETREKARLDRPAVVFLPGSDRGFPRPKGPARSDRPGPLRHGKTGNGSGPPGSTKTRIRRSEAFSSPWGDSWTKARWRRTSP